MRLRATLVLFLLCPSAGFAETLKLFSDRGSTWVRTRNTKLLQVGAAFDARVDEAGPSVGTGVIMEVNGMLARVALDDGATAAKAKVLVTPTPPPTAAPGPSAARRSLPPPRPLLKGRLVHGPIRMKVFNDSAENWTGCTLRYSDGASYPLGQLAALSDEGVLKVRFVVAPAPAVDRVSVSCSQGQATFVFGNAPSTGSLKGRAEERSGRTFLFNDSDLDWSNCEVRRSDGSSFLLGTLKAHESDGTANGRFKAPEVDLMLSLECDQGRLETKVIGPRLP